MKIVCATSVLLGQEAFATLGDVVGSPERAITKEMVRDADALITRSKVRMDRSLLDGSRVSFVGTATAGTDHMDLDYLAEREIVWCAAPGCNANSVAEYVVAALLCLANRHDLALEGKKIAIVGVGHVGRRVSEMAQALGMKPLLNDPPLHALTGDPIYRTLDDILSEADVVTLHVPLIEHGPYPTRHMVGARFFEKLKPGCIFINAARGEVVDSASLLLALQHGAVAHAVLDVFENEPEIRADIMDGVDIATAHIAGYSYEGKLNGTVMVYREARQFFESNANWPPPRLNAADSKIEWTMDARLHSHEEMLWTLVRRAYDIEEDDRALRTDEGRNFEELRARYKTRHEFPAHAANIAQAPPRLREMVKRLGFGSTKS